MMKFLKYIFRKTGFEIRRLPYKYYSKAGKTLIVEFIGPPGIGKSTYLERFAKYTNINFYNGAEFGFFEPVRDNLKEYHVKIFRERVIKLQNKDIHNDHFFYSANHLIDQINNDTKYLSVKNCVITEEGLFHLFAPELKRLAAEDLDLFKTTLYNRVFINITGSPEKICQNIIDRYNKTGRILPEHKTSKENIIEMSKNSMMSKNKLMEIVKSHNGKCLEIEIENRIDDNVMKIDKFIRNNLKS